MLPASAEQSARVLEHGDLNRLFGALRNRGHLLLGPAIRDGAIVYEELESADDLPAGWSDEQEGGSYRLKKRKDNALFSYNCGPHSWKQFLHPAREQLWRVARDGGNIHFEPAAAAAPKQAFIGVRSCELHAIAIQDRVLTEGPYADSGYAARRRNTFIVAVNCGRAAATCFCASMNTGPRASSGFDLALTEVLDRERHYFTIEAGSDGGREILDELALRPAAPAETAAAAQAVSRATAQIRRKVDTEGLKEVLQANHDSPRWDQVAARCLNCANCTLVCPTCFCTTVEDVSDLSGQRSERYQVWDSCFTMQFSYIHGGSVRATPKARYRQWLMHKFAAWFDQFGSSGCVGCGRCIAWCPVGIDVTEELRGIHEGDKSKINRKGSAQAAGRGMEQKNDSADAAAPRESVAREVIG